MAKILGLFPSAIDAAKAGASFRAWEREVRALGLGARSSEMNQLFRIAQQAVARAGNELGSPLEGTPSGGDFQPWPTKTATGYGQTVVLTYRDKATGHLNPVYYRVTTQTPLTRQEVVNMATAAYAGSAEEYEQEMVGAVYSSTARYIPE